MRLFLAALLALAGPLAAAETAAAAEP
ncbi:MAG: hypothetical protein RL479_1510, partial [Verrucomicrobiota bacterium]